MEGMEMKQYKDVYRNRTVLLTGNTGFKGSWLALWLNKLGAKVYGMALPPEKKPNHWDLLRLNIQDYNIDIRNFQNVLEIFQEKDPEIVFHLAAQPLVHRSYRDPLETWSTNVLGTANILEACRKTETVKSIIVITTDKVYENKEWIWGYRENEQLGGHDPYSASKASSELVVESYRRSFFNTSNVPLVATARAGNVIGGGDWSEDRLIPDLVRAMENDKTIAVRSPNATRPWQHVLECLNGYLMLGQKLIEGNQEYAGAWNFGPNPADNCTVSEVLQRFKQCWQNVTWEVSKEQQPHEATSLYLDNTKAASKLNWKPVWDLDRCIKETAKWYQLYYSMNKVDSIDQLEKFIDDAKSVGCGDV